MRSGWARRLVIAVLGLGAVLARADEPREAPGPDWFYVPGHWAPTDGRTTRPNLGPNATEGLTWRPGFWAKNQPDWTWRPSGWSKAKTADGETWTFRPGFWERRQAAFPLAHWTAADIAAFKQALLWVGAPFDPAQADPYSWSRITPNQPVTPGQTITPGTTYYVGHSAPGMAYPSVSQVPVGPLGSSYYAGHSAPGMAYPSVATAPIGPPGSTYYVGQSAPGMSYPSVSPVGTVVGGYGYGTTAPGAPTGGQVGSPAR